jgi:hypothetical protein
MVPAQHAFSDQCEARQSDYEAAHHARHSTVALDLGCHCFQISRIFRLLHLFGELDMMKEEE